MKARLLALAALVAVAAQTARADTPPSTWDKIRDPALRDRFDLHTRAREEILAFRQSSAPPAIRQAKLAAVRVLLEEAHAAQSPDPLLRFDLGEIYEMQLNFTRAIDVLKPAIDLAPDLPAALTAYISLANAYAYLDRSADERDVYERYLARATEVRSRAIAMLNLAEAHMHLGDLTDAVAEYKETIDVASSLPNVIELEDNTGLLAVWGLAVALDRSGDESGGATKAVLAEQLDPNERVIRSGANVFFVPKYERLWYLALGATVHAKEATTVKESAERWAIVEAYWTAYVQRANPRDRWLAQAHAHKDRAAASRASAQRRAGMALKPPAPLVLGED
jgi:tetratricopeptide (TPR) repeat protein